MSAVLDSTRNANLALAVFVPAYLAVMAGIMGVFPASASAQLTEEPPLSPGLELLLFAGVIAATAIVALVVRPFERGACPHAEPYGDASSLGREDGR